jgi:hypothetical protein
MYRKKLIVRSLALAFSATALTVGVGPAAYAQTSATGTVVGRVDSPAGATVVIENVSTGARRTMTPGADGKYQATSMPVGEYKVTLQRNGAVVGTREGVLVTIGGSSDADFVATSLERVEVVGFARKQLIDVSAVGSTTSFSASELAKLPIQGNVGAVIQLAPQTTRGDTRYGGGGAPSFGGASASENAYYINGFPVTTLLTQVGFSQLPFNAIAQAQLMTGGYGAEFGRSTGGVVNLVTKSGGNDIVFGIAGSIEPNSLRSKEKSSRYENNGLPNTDGKYRFYNDDNKRETTSVSTYFGAPLVKDKFFLFFAGEDTNVDRSRIRTANNGGAGTANSATTTGWQEQNTNKARTLLKLDWNITDQHHLEYTNIYDAVRDQRRYYSFDYNTLQRGTVQNGGDDYVNWGPVPTAAAEQGAKVDILKYTGFLTNDFTFTTLVGRTRTPHDQKPFGYNPNLPRVIITDAGRRDVFNYITPQGTTTLLVPGAFDENKGARLDAEWRVNSEHTVRAGVDYNKITSYSGTSDAGGTRWTYSVTNPAVALLNSVPLNTVVGNPFASVDGLYVFQENISTQATPSLIQSAVYIEDKFQLTDRLLLSLGLRNEAFDNRNGDGVSYIKIDRQLAPRFGVAWDVLGTSSLKVFGSAGRYHVPLPTNVAIRAAGSSLFTTQNFAYTGVDPVTGAPTGLTAISPVFSANNEFGQAKDPRQVTAQNMKGNYQDELAFGMEQALSKDLSVGAKFTYRTLRTAIDDHCDDRPFRAWADRQTVPVDHSNWGYNCALFNPGIANTFTIDIDGDGVLETINLSAEDLGLPKVKRKYVAVDLFAEHPFDGKWAGKVNYTWSRNTGNAEGQLLSDIGQGDVATTQNYDFPEFSVNADGRLPNDRTHQIKAFGYYQATPSWGIGANFLAASGRPKNCIGGAPSQPALTTPFVPGVSPVTNYSGYGSAYFFCNGQASPRGSQGNLPPDLRLDLNVAFRPEAVPGLKLQVDVFNAFNRQSIEVIEERHDNASSGIIFSRYGHVESYTAPRTVKLSVSYDYKF